MSKCSCGVDWACADHTLQPGPRRPPAPADQPGSDPSPVLRSPWTAPTAWTGRRIPRTNPRATSVAATRSSALRQPRWPSSAAPPHPLRAAAAPGPVTRVTSTAASHPSTTAQPLATSTTLTMTHGQRRHSPGTPSSPPTTHGARRRPGLCEGPNGTTAHPWSLLR